MKIIGPRSLFLNQAFLPLTMMLWAEDAPVERESGNLVYVVKNPNDPDITIERILGWCGAGGEITGYRCFIEMTPEAYATQIPDGLPRAGETWASLPNANHTHEESGGKYYFKNNYFGEYQVPLSGTQLALVNGIEGAALLTAAKYSEK